MDKRSTIKKTNPFMTEKDREAIETMLTKAMAAHSDNVEIKLDAKFEVVNFKLDAVDKKLSYTNGKVAENIKEIEALKTANGSHVTNCPQAEKIRALEDAETGRKAVKSFTWKQWLVASGLGAIVIMIIQAIIEKL